MNTILIATDGSLAARAALERGLDLAEETSAHVIFVAVRRPPLPVFGDPYWQTSITNELARLRPALAAAIAEAEARGSTRTTTCSRETPPKRSCDSHARATSI
jgi:nucleotide-binding universal stress UspA family protein